MLVQYVTVHRRVVYLSSIPEMGPPLVFAYVEIELVGHQEAIKARGLRDDTTCLVVDIAPRNSEVPFAPAVKKQTNFQKLLRCISVKEAHIDYDLNIMEEIFDENSPALAER